MAGSITFGWLLLRRRIDRPGSWVLANGLAWMGLAVALGTGLFLVRLLDRARPDTGGDVGVRSAAGR